MKKRIKYFQDEVLRWMDLFGLGRWSVKWVGWDTIPADFRDADAAARSDVPARLVEFTINPDKLKDKSDAWISRCALHEVAHVLTARMEDFAYKSNVDHDAIDEEREALAKSIERAFFGPVDSNDAEVV